MSVTSNRTLAPALPVAAKPNDGITEMRLIRKSDKLADVCYDIRGPVLARAKQMEDEGQRIIKLNIGNLAPFGFEVPEEIVVDVIHNLREASGYSDSKGLFAARKAVMHYTQQKQIAGVGIEDIYIGVGASELIVMAMQALLNNGDEVLVPAPDYPLWTAAVSLGGGKPVHYICDEGADWFPDVQDIEQKITSRTRALVLINPNNPTGAVYSPELLQDLIRVARKHQLIIFSDEIYSKILYDDAVHTPVASLCDDLLIVTFNGLSKSYRLAGFRSGWMILSGAREKAGNYIEGLEVLSNMRLCANVPAQFAVQTALGGYQSINELIIPGGRLRDQRDIAYDLLSSIPGVSCVKPKGAIYMFPRLDPDMYPIADDEQFVLDLLEKEKILLVQGSAFNMPDTQHLRIVFLPTVDVLQSAVGKIERFLGRWAQSH